ncbi:MAG: DUF5057 domain-containing protein [Lachnospiraceae bacterium]|nr:DUF5057 domain-containing protein [Lachnospiraceae bacterium]
MQMRWNELIRDKKKLIIRICSIATVLVAAIGICTFVAKKATSSVEASTNVLKRVSDKYTAGSTFKILEVVPEHTSTEHENEEIGYFMADSQNKQDFMDVSRAKSIGSFLAPDGVSNLLLMRDYGLIKESGVDYGTSGGNVSDNPVYSDKATFSTYPMTGFEAVGTQFTYGVYDNDPSNKGDYKTKEGYMIDNGTIYAINGGSVSDNTVSSNHVGGGALTRTLSVIANTTEETGSETTQTENVPVVNEAEEVTVTVEDEEAPAEAPVETPEAETPAETPGAETPVETPDDTNNQTGQGANLQRIEEGVTIAPVDGTVGAGGDSYYQGVGAVPVDYEPVAEGDRFNKALPEGIEYVGDGTGNVIFTESPAGKYFGYTSEKLYYNKDTSNHFYNGEWFKELVFGDKGLGITISIETKTPSEITTMNGYDLVYISGTNEAYIGSGVDLTDSQVMELYNAVISSNYQAVIMDYALIDATTIVDKASAGSLTNFEKLALLLWQDDQTDILENTVSGNTAGLPNNGFTATVDGSGFYSISSFGDVPNSIWYHLTTSVSLTGYGNFVAGSVYVYDHRLQYFDSPKAQIDAYDFFGNGDFNSKYVDHVVAAGFSDVEYTVKVNNSNNPDKKMSEKITPAVVVQYILTYDGTASALVKNELRVLEIQPCRSFLYNTAWGTETYSEIEDGTNRNKAAVLENRNQFIENYLGEPFFKDGKVDTVNRDYVVFTSMTIEEFICKNENVNEEYDIIYIGSNYSSVNSYDCSPSGNYNEVDNKDYVAGTDTPKRISDFRDNNMDGMVYFNIGDLVYVSQYGTENKGNPKYSLWGSIANENGAFRHAGRDLTVYKKQELLDYLDTGYPIIVAGDLMRTEETAGYKRKVINPTQTTTFSSHAHDHGRIDNSSELYELFEIATGLCTDTEKIGSYSATGYYNFISEADVLSGEVRKDDIVTAVNTTKLAINITSRPTEYEYTLNTEGAITSQTGLVSEADNKYYLTFEFTLQNLSAEGDETDIYNPHLYIDVNADGKFSETEELEGAVVTNALTGEEVPYTASINGNAYSLTTNVLYKLKREVPEGYQGSLPWCLKVAKYSNSKISASETGYSAIKGDEPVTINVLQIMKGGKGSGWNNLDLEDCITKAYDSNPYNDNKYGIYIKQLETLGMFKIQVKSISISDYNRRGAYNRTTTTTDASGNLVTNTVATSYYEHLEDFDMLILGFADNYIDLGAGPGLNALEQYIRDGKPVLLSHDFMAHYPNYEVVKKLRDIVGMDRYGVTDSSLTAVKAGVSYSRGDASDLDEIEKIESSGRRVAYQPGSGKKVLVKETQGFTSYIETRYADTRDYKYLVSPDFSRWAWSANQDYVMFINKVNDGQITNYPYILPENFAVNKTHGQYFQLNMESDQDEDGSPDITVWYTLAYGHSSPNTPDADTATSKYSDGVYNATPKNGVNTFYIYNCGNVTYTGSGHSSLTSPSNTYEAQLFINTIVAAYKAGIKSPKVSIYEGENLNSSVITNITVPYDENIGRNATDTNKAESSIIKDRSGNYKYPFVEENDANATKVFFRVADPNLVKGSKSIDVRFLLEVDLPSGTAGTETITLDNGETIVVIELAMPFYSANFTNTYAYGSPVSSGVMYGLKLPMDLLTSSSNFKIYVEAETTITNVSVTGDKTISKSGKAYTSLGVTKMDLLKLD